MTTPLLLEPIADRVWVGYAESNVVVIGGDRGVVVVDAPAGGDGGSGLVEAIRALGAGDVVAVVATHGHADHVAGLDAVRRAWPAALVHAHESAGVDRVDHLFASVAVVELGDRVLELVHPGPAHSRADVVIRVPEADVVAVGDLAAGDGELDRGPESSPALWPASLEVVLGMMTEATVVVPGHGRLLDRQAVEEQQFGAGALSDELRGDPRQLPLV